MALTKWEIDARNQQIADAQAAIRAGNAAAAQAIVNNLIGGSRVGGAQAALQGAISSMPPPASPPAETKKNDPSGTVTTTASSGAGGGQSAVYYPPTPSSTPPSPYWITTPSSTTGRSGIKQADPDIVLDPEINTTGDYIVERFFEELGGTELISLSRHDLIDGIDVTYSPIANLSRLRRRFNPNNIIAIDFLSENEFTRTSIDLLSRGIYEPYFDNDGNLVVEIDIIKPEENIETEVSSSGTVSRIEL